MAKKQDEMSENGRDILAGMKETLDYVKGKPIKGRMTLMAGGNAIDIRAIRAELGMTRAEFAKAFHFKPKTVQNWEQGIRTPSDHTLAYLRLIAANPKAVAKQLHS